MYLGLLFGEKEYHFEDIRSAIWWWEYKRTVTALLMPFNVLAQLHWRAQKDKMDTYWWSGRLGGDIRICGIPVIIDERVEGIEYLIEEDAP